MAHFFGVIIPPGKKKQPTATSTKALGLATVCASWEGAVKVELFHKDGGDHYRVVQLEWPSGKPLRILSEGRFSDGQR